MPQEILINVGAAEIRIAAVIDGRLEALNTQRTLESGAGASTLVGDIVLGRVVRVVPAVQAAFVDIGQERAGFLGAREARCLKPGADAEPSIGTLVHEGQKLLVQIVKDPIGEKGARLTAAVTIPGRFCVLTAAQPGVALSRRIEDEAERARLCAMAEALLAGSENGCILRTAAVGIAAEELREDLDRLSREWETIVAAENASAVPATLHRDLGPIERALRDTVRAGTSRILIDDANAVERARAYCRSTVPHMEEKIALFAGPGGLFDDFESDIDTLMLPRVELPGGGWITIEGTEALTAIDVNSGSFVHASAIEDTGLTVNLEAATEIGRQIRLRGIGGLIVIDFIHMKDAGHIERVHGELSRSLSLATAPFNIGPVTSFGLTEVTRKRVRESLLELSSERCPHCDGRGRIPRTEAVAMEAVRRIERAGRAAPGKVIHLRAAPEIVRWLNDEGMADRLGRKIRLQITTDETLPRQSLEVGTDG